MRARVTDKKVAWVIGASSGIGAALAHRLADMGWTVAISARREKELDRMAQGRDIYAFPLDVTEAAVPQYVARRIAEQFGRIDLMVYSAAAWQPLQTGDYPVEKFQRIVNTNLLGAVRVIQPVKELMERQGGGQIALIGSVAGYFGLPRAAAYGSTKAALNYLAASLRTELAPRGIDVRLIAPGFVRTPLTAKNDFRMPFLLEPEDAARRIAHGLIRTRRFEIAFPRRLVWPMKALRLLPYPLFFRIMARLMPDREA